MNKEIKGLSYPFRVGGRGGVVMSGRTITEEQHIKECIMTLLGTREWERVMRPGNGIEDLDVFFDDLNETTKAMAAFKIREAITAQEPRVEVRDVTFAEVQTDNGMGHVVNVAYEVLASGEAGSMAVSI